MKIFIYAFTVMFSLILFVSSCGGADKKVNNKKSDGDSLRIDSTKLSKHKETTPIIKMFVKNDVDMGDNPCKSLILLSIKADTVNGYLYDCSNEYDCFTYLNIIKKSSEIKGDAVNVCSDIELPNGSYGDDFSKYKIKLTFNQDSSVLNVNGIIYKAIKNDYYFSNQRNFRNGEEELMNLMIDQNTKSKKITTFTSRDKPSLIEIGKLDRSKKNKNQIYFKIKVKNQIGWILGGMSFKMLPKKEEFVYTKEDEEYDDARLQMMQDAHPENE